MFKQKYFIIEVVECKTGNFPRHFFPININIGHDDYNLFILIAQTVFSL